ncbi:MAG: VTT domain-containing protein [Dehalococcoidia bacterium]|nr:VTT domain-containing protein [Dehalococcoidia bacterium]
MAGLKGKQWRRIVLYLLVLFVISTGLAYGLKLLMANLDVTGRGAVTTAYVVVFVTSLIFNASIVVPVPVHASVMMALASQWDPLPLALFASIGGTIGEITGYYAGYFGKKVMLADSMPGYDRFAGWMKKYGLWAIWAISFQPLLPVDIAGITAGISRLPLWKFLLPCWAGKFPKYLIFCSFGAVFSQFLPPWF